MDRDGEVNNVAAAVKLGQADEGEGAEGNKEEGRVLSELSLSWEQQHLSQPPPPPTSSGLRSPINPIYIHTIVFEVQALSVLVDMSW